MHLGCRLIPLLFCFPFLFQVPDELSVKQMLQGRPSKLESRFRLTYNMLLNLLRQEDMKVEEFIRRSFGELTTAKETPKRKMLLERGERKLRHQKPVACNVEGGGLGCSVEDMTEYFNLSHEIARIQTRLFASLFVPASAASSKYLSIGRVMLLNIRGLENCAAVVLRNQLPLGGAASSSSSASVAASSSGGSADLNRKAYIAFVLVPPLQALSEKYVSQARSLGLILGSTSGVGNAPKLHYLISEFGPSHIVALLNEKLEVDVAGVLVDRFPRKMDALATDLLTKVQERFGTPVSAAAHAQAVEAGIAAPLPPPGPTIGKQKPPLPMLPRALHPSRLPAHLLMDPLSDIKLNVGGGGDDGGEGGDNFQLLDEQFLKMQYQRQLASSPVQACPKAAEHYSVLLRQHALASKVSQLRALLSHDNLDLHADFQHRINVLARLGYVDAATKSTVQLKGRVACEINTCPSLVVTELIFENALTRLEPEEIVSVLSCLIFQEKQADEPVLPERLQVARAELERVARSVAQLELQCGLDVDPQDFVRDHINAGMMQVVWEWAKGTKFSDICAFTNVLEGSIVRCITRLDETCRDVRNAAKVVGDAPLAAKMQRASELIKRDIVFAASLYVA
jgi:antiviral helicase SKI2